MRIPRAVYRSAAVLGVGATGGVGSTPGKGKGSGRGSVTKERGRSRGPFGVARRWGTAARGGAGGGCLGRQWHRRGLKRAVFREEGEGLRPRQGPRDKGSRDQLGSGSGVGFESGNYITPRTDHTSKGPSSGRRMKDENRRSRVVSQGLTSAVGSTFGSRSRR